MKRLFCLLLLIIGGLANAQRGPPLLLRQGQMRIFNPDTVVRIEGRVIAVRSTPTQAQGITVMVHVSIQTTEGDTFSVQLAPSWYLEQQGFTLQVGDDVTIRGSWVEVAGNYHLVASSIQNGSQELQLRDANGTPVWTGLQNRSTTAYHYFPCRL